MQIKTNMEATEKIRDAVKRFGDRKKLAELAEEYGRAIELIGRLMQNKIKTDKAR